MPIHPYHYCTVGTDKILQPMGGEGSRTDKTTITNDGATILKSVWLDNPAAKILVGEFCFSHKSILEYLLNLTCYISSLTIIWLASLDVSKQQDTQCGDGTTGVVVLAAELLRNAEQLVEQRIHPQVKKDARDRSRGMF